MLNKVNIFEKHEPEKEVKKEPKPIIKVKPDETKEELEAKLNLPKKTRSIEYTMEDINSGKTSMEELKKRIKTFEIGKKQEEPKKVSAPIILQKLDKSKENEEVRSSEKSEPSVKSTMEDISSGKTSVEELKKRIKTFEIGMKKEEPKKVNEPIILQKYDKPKENEEKKDEKEDKEGKAKKEKKKKDGKEKDKTKKKKGEGKKDSDKKRIEDRKSVV